MLIPTLASILILAGAVWLIIIAVQTGQSTGEKVLWALVNLLCQPLGGIIFYVMKRQGLVPLLMVIAGWLVMVLSGGMAAFTNMAPMP